MRQSTLAMSIALVISGDHRRAVLADLSELFRDDCVTIVGGMVSRGWDRAAALEDYRAWLHALLDEAVNEAAVRL